MNRAVQGMVNKALEPFVGAGVGLDSDGRLCLPDGLDATRVHRFIELVLATSFETPKDALCDLFGHVGVAPRAIKALDRLLGDELDVELAAIGRDPIGMGRAVKRLLEVPNHFRIFLVDGLELGDPHGETLEEVVVSTRKAAAAHIGCKPRWDAILAREKAVRALSSEWRSSLS